jgi:hypothetical protein
MEENLNVFFEFLNANEDVTIRIFAISRLATLAGLLER